MRSPHPENAFLIDALRASLTPGSRIAIPQGPLFDWAAVVDLAASHRLTSVLFSTADSGPPTSPSYRLLTERAIQITAQNLAMTSALRSTCSLLERSDVLAAAAPSPAVALLATGSPSYELSDADLLIKPADEPNAIRALEDDGYRRTMSKGGASRFVLNGRDNRSVVIRSRVEGGPVRSRFPIADALAHAVECTAPGGTLRVLATEELLVALCARGAVHGWPTLDYVVAIAALGRRVADWPRVVATARIARRERSVNIGVLLARRLLGVDLPGSDTARDGLARQTAAKIARRLREPVESPTVGPGPQTRTRVISRHAPRTIILRQFQSPGDLVMLTAAVRDLHLLHPGQFVTDVRTPCPDLWRNNPFITPLDESGPGVEALDCEYR